MGMFHLRERGPESTLPGLEAFRDVAEVIDSAIVLVTPERRIVYMNKAAQQMCGAKEGSLCYRTLRNSRKVCSDCPLGGVIETSKVSRKELRMHAADGWHTYEKLFIPLRGPYPHPQLVALLGTNIDYQKHLEQEVTREKELSRAILSAPSTFAIGVEANGRVEFVNRAWEDISGYSEREMIEGGGFHTLVPGEYRGEVDDYLSSMSHGAKPATGLVVPFLTKGGEEKIFSWTYSLISGEAAGAEKAVMIGQDVTERVRARIEVERWARELEVVNKILKNAGASVAAEEMLDTTLNELLELPGYRCGVSYLLGDAGESGRRLAMLGFAKSEPPRTLRGIEGAFPATAVYNRKIEFAWPDIEMHPAAREILDGEGLKGIVAVPLVPGGRPVGMLLLGHDFGAERAEEDRSVIEAAAEAFELGAENLFFRARAEGRAREATALFRVARSVTGEMALDRVLERVVEEAAGLFRVDVSSIFLYDEDTGLLTGKAGVGAEVGSIEIPLEESGTASQAARTLKPVVVEDTEKDSRVPRFVVEDYGVRSSLGVPLVVEGRFAGALFLDMRSKRRYSQRELELIESFAGQAATAIRSAFLLDDLRESEEKYRALVESAEDIVLTADTEGRITFVNEAVFAALEYMPEEVVGRGLSALNREEDHEAVMQWLDRLLGGSRVKEERYRVWSKSGREVLLDISLAPLEVGGKVMGISGIARDVTEHVRAAEALRDSEEQSRALVESSLFGVLMHDGKNILYMNDRAVEMSGYSREEINSVEDGLNMLVPEEREEAVGRIDRRLAGEETPRVYDTRMRRKDGSIAVVQVQNTQLTLGGRNATIAALNDITDRVRAEEAVLASEERYRVIVETSPNAVLIANPHGEILFANVAGGELAGMPREELIGRNIGDFLAPGEVEKVNEEFKAALGAGRGIAKRLTRVIAGGAERYFEASASAIGGPGPDARAVIIANDVTERELAQRKLRESEERYRTIVEASGDTILIVNRGGEILYANPEVERAFGVKPGEVTGKHIFRFIHPDDRAEAAGAIAEDYKRGSTKPSFPVTCVREDGTLVHVEVKAGLVGWPGDDALEILVIRDVTKRKKREEERELRLKVEEARAGIATRLVNPEDIYEAIRDTLEQTGDLLGVNRAHYFEFSGDGEAMSCNVEWVAEGDEPTKDKLQAFRIADFPWLMENLSAGRTMAYRDIEEMPEDAVREVLKSQNILAIALAPIFVAERLAGFMSYHDVQKNREWSVPEVEMLRDVAETISHALERRKWVDELERSERFRARITESIGEGLMVLWNGVVTWVNRQACEILGYGPEELTGRTTEHLFPDNKRLDEFALEAATALFKGKRYTREGKVKRKDGTLVDVMVSLSSMGVAEEDYSEIVAAITDITEAKRMREKIEAAAEAYSTIFSAAGDGLIISTIDGDIRDANERACVYTGYSREELLAENVRNLVPEKVRHLFRDRQGEVLRDGYTAFETKLLKKGGGTLPVEITVRMTPVWGEEVVLAALHDISERKKAEVEARRRAVQLVLLNQILRATTRSLDLDVASNDILSVSMEVSGAEAGILVLEDPPGTGEFKVMVHEGFPPGYIDELDTDISKSALAEFTSGPEGAVVIDVPALAATEMGGEVVRLLDEEGIRSALFVPLKRADRVTGVLGLASKKRGLFSEDDRDFYNAVGAEIRVSVQNAIIYRELLAEHERLALLYRSAQDISEQTELESLLNTTAREAAEAIGAEAALIALVDTEHNEFVWRAAYNLDLGLLAGVHMATDKGMGGEVIRTRRAAFIETGEDMAEDVLDDPATVAVVATSGVAVPLISGDRIVGVMGVQGLGGRKVSDEYVLLLEAMGRHAGVAIENARLYEETRTHLQSLEVAHQELMELDRMKSDFVSTVSHELRSPLAVIEGFARTLVEHFDRIGRDTEKESLEIILKKSTILEGLIANILDMSRIEAGRLEVNFDILDLRELCQRVVGDEERMVEVHEINLVTPDKEMEVVADPDRAEVVLGNLIRNAIKFSPEGGAVMISVREAGDMAEVSVTDEGIGIPEEEHEKIFGRFYQVDSGENRSFPGTGLGLYITNELLHAMGGTIRVESEPGKGSTFTFTLPLAGRAEVAEGSG